MWIGGLVWPCAIDRFSARPADTCSLDPRGRLIDRGPGRWPGFGGLPATADEAAAKRASSSKGRTPTRNSLEQAARFLPSTGDLRDSIDVGPLGCHRGASQGLGSTHQGLPHDSAEPWAASRVVSTWPRASLGCRGAGRRARRRRRRHARATLSTPLLADRLTFCFYTPNTTQAQRRAALACAGRLHTPRPAAVALSHAQ